MKYLLNPMSDMNKKSGLTKLWLTILVRCLLKYIRLCSPWHKILPITDCITEENKLGFKRVLYKFVLKYFHQNQNLVIFHTNRHHIPPVHWLYCKTIMVRKWNITQPIIVQIVKLHLCCDIKIPTQNILPSHSWAPYYNIISSLPGQEQKFHSERNVSPTATQFWVKFCRG